MPFDPHRLLTHSFPQQRQDYTKRDAILYALGLGLGRDPLDEAELHYLLEDRLLVAPTFGVTLGSQGLWVRDPALGIDWVKLVHVEQDARFHARLPPEATIVSDARIISVGDRGVDKGAVVVLERDVRDAASSTCYCTITQTLLLRGDGGYGGGPPLPGPLGAVPDRPADASVVAATSPRAALIYRLSGDWNPIHADPATAQAAGFERPILQGLASYGMAGMAVLRMKDPDRTRLRRLALRFTGIVHPGDRLDFSIWEEGRLRYFQARVGDRLVLDRGLAEIEDDDAR
jgi:acyl dehydratase